MAIVCGVPNFRILRYMGDNPLPEAHGYPLPEAHG